MASLQTLRNKGGVIVAVVIGIALLAFVLGDMLSSGSMLFGNNNSVGKIDGTSITYEQYSQQINTLTEILKVTSGSETITEEQTQSIQQQAWDQLVMRYAVTPQFTANGIVVGLNEMTELMTGRYVSPMVQQFFASPETGQFDAAVVRQFLSNIDQDPTGRLQLFWSNLQSDVNTQAQMIKFKTLVDKGSYITSLQAQFLASIESSNYSVRFVAEKLSTIADSTVAVTDAELKEFYNSHKAMFEKGVSRSIDYVVFETLPSTTDYEAAAKYMAGLKTEFETATDVKQFVSLNSQSPFDTRYYKEGELSGDLGTFAFTATTSDVYAPELSGDQYTLARISDVRVLPDSVNFSHIVFDIKDKNTADSLANVIRKNETSFADAASVYSLDKQSAAKGGEVGTLDPQTLAIEFAEPLLTTPKGAITVITTPTTAHIVKINDRIGEGRKVQLGTIKYTVEATEATRSLSFNNAATFANAAKSGDFQKLVSDEKLSKRSATLGSTQRELAGYKNSREAIRWAYNAKVGQTSDVMEFGNSFVIASLTTITEEGIAPLDQVKSDVEAMVRMQKKGEMIAQKMKGSSVDDLAVKLGTNVIEAADISFSTYIAPEVGFDVAFAGGVCATGEGNTSKPIIGRMAVYVAQVTGALSNPVSPAIVRQRVAAEQEQAAFYKAYQTILRGNVIDERYKFF